jgi:uncharacterized membrane protein
MRLLSIAAFLTSALFTQISFAEPLTCVGTEPFWSMKFKPEGIELNMMGQDKTLVLEHSEPTTIAGTTAEFAEVYKTHAVDKSIPHSGHAIVVRKNVDCNDGMSDQIYQHEIYVVPMYGVPLYGCCNVKSQGKN